MFEIFEKNIELRVFVFVINDKFNRIEFIKFDLKYISISLKIIDNSTLIELILIRFIMKKYLR